MQSNLYLLQRESEFVTSGEAAFKNCIEALNEKEKLAKKVDKSKTEKEISDIDKEIATMRTRLDEAKQARRAVQDEHGALSQRVLTSGLLRDALAERANQMESVYMQTQEQISSVAELVSNTVESLDRFKQINTLNDAFYIWYTGPFATINTFKLGSLVNKPVEFTEINAALGQAALCVHIISSRCGVDFKAYCLTPMGSCPRISKADDKRTSYPLFIDQSSFSFFPKRNFNLALLGFMQCIQELGEYISAYDPTLAVPYKIDVNTSCIGGKSFVYGADEEEWTHALKFMLANIKWIIAWYCKHGAPGV
ncbi:Atg6/Beclin [Ochromonadaceae sp. CCMP2298]|nr:Atg6/Beclin [Ochromonadaceae sp. CCMP2298]|mmetsp:Transcript_4168/g.9333  ORF Transcript_4168/g.9333 Transcript_4168/m.9333 type:complete len:309 (-) Transcript_4168:54-980(-)